LKLHLRAARNSGVSVDEVKEALLQTAIYCGVPAANSAFAIAQHIFSEMPE
jgi:alkylhydroperoxidase/carboxymuconolactone decarboxylase family protein YurZ